MNNNKGMSLVEIVVSLAILGIVVASVCTFMNIGMNTSTASTSIASVQKEAQTVQNQVQSWIMEANKGIVCYEGQANFDYAIAIYHDGISASERYIQVVYYRKEEKKLFYHKLMAEGQVNGTVEDLINDSNAIESAGDWDSYLLSSFVSNLSLDTAKIKDQVVTFTIDYEVKGKSYHVSNTVKLRNEVEEHPTNYSR
ncbi:MAG: prepilin-type N-terminal cleavage/methylation domain-containing protein [bacterium]|nr:prepilin-type N-terminal cleavage/methylation domain-containing protein [bacterium]